MNPPSTLRSWYEAGRRPFLVRLAATGVVAGLASWLLVRGLRRLAGSPVPSTGELILAVALGALFGAALALVLGAYWDRRPGSDRP